ncbi:SDR family oxidoreductase [Candidatus Pacearchaeota archaeon]|nr:SDR family oxidoreductase [Candidatus Pacearchaeota archaeon]
MEKSNGVIVFGASGLIGRYLYTYLKNNGEKVIGTYFENPEEGLIHYDLVNSSIDELDLRDIKYAIISSAATKLDKCKDNPEYSQKVNVFGIKKLIKEVSKKGIIPVFMSSASVFNGLTGGYSEEDERDPISLYGKQKVEVEDFLISNFKDYLIIRPGKIFGVQKCEGVLFTDWYEKYKKNEEILCADDEQLAPTYAKDVAEGIAILIQKNCKGIYHVNYPEHFSRYEMALNFFSFLGINYNKFRSCSIKDFNFSEKRMKNSYLNISKFIKETGFRFTPLEECYKEIIKNI